MLTSFVVLIRDTQNQTLAWCPAISETAEDALAVVGATLAQQGRADMLVVAPFTREQIASAMPLLDQMDQMIAQQDS